MYWVPFILFICHVYNSFIGFLDGKSVMCADTMAVILKFLAEVCMEGQMRDWLGSPEGSLFWAPLLTMLCNKPNNDDDRYVNFFI